MKRRLIDRFFYLIGATKLTAIAVFLFSLSILVMDGIVVLSGHELPTSSIITTAIFGTLSLIGALSSGWLLFTHSGGGTLTKIIEDHASIVSFQTEPPLTIDKLGQIIFASLALSFGTILLSIIIVLFAAGPDVISKYFDRLFIPLIIGIAILWFPFAKKHIK